MPEYSKPAGRDIIEGFELRLRDLERQVSALQGRRLLSVDRGTTTGVPAPVEGQVMVEETDEKLKWYSNGQWREPQTGGTYHNTTPVYALHGGDMAHFAASGYMSGFNFTEDLTLRYGGYLQSTAQNAYFIIGMPLGPPESRWAVDLYYNTGTDYGIFDVEWQTTSVDATGSYGAGGSTATITEMIEEPDPSGSWYNSGRDATNWQFDAYAASPGVVRRTQMDNFTMVGTSGTLLTANGTLGNVTYEMDAAGDGSVWWWLRLKVKSKHASSSGYRCRIQAIRVTRLAEAGWYFL